MTREIGASLGPPPRRILGKDFYIYRDRSTGLNLHLRVEEDKSGTLIVNASKVLFLNPTATEHVRLFMQNKEVGEAVRYLKKRFKASAETLRTDHLEIINAVNSVASSDVCPISYLGFKRFDPFSQEIKAPYRLDLALTYRCNNACIHCYAGKASAAKELSTEEWKTVIDKAFELRIPQILFTGGEPTMRDDLPELVAQTERYGIVSGIVTNGRRLSDPELVQRLASAGIDFIQVTLESNRPEVHEKITLRAGSHGETVQGIRNILKQSLYVSVNTTLNPLNMDHGVEMVDFLNDLGVKRMSVNALIHAGRGADVAKDFAVPPEKLKQTLIEMRDRALQLGMRFEWYTPTCYEELDPVSLNLGLKTCTAARVTMCVEPDGDVLPCQSYYSALGNILTDPWETIWNHPLARRLRNREYASERCQQCVHFISCGGGCPLEWDSKEVLCTDASCRVVEADRQVAPSNSLG